MKKVIIILIILLIGLFTRCVKKENPLPTELPPITESGENTFGCLIEDEIFVPDIRRIVCCEAQAIPIVFDFPKYPEYFFRISAVRKVNKNDNAKDAEVVLMVDSIFQGGSFSLFYATVKYENVYYYTDSIDNGTIEILKLDSINNIISGLFYFQAIDKNNTNSKIINIINGRFDLKLK
ncbi:MAG: hypothetical protein KAT68_15605 [Bacteroidales bacterium]|nr:hypothetical protein [Bacteroidales bacterium]